MKKHNFTIGIALALMLAGGLDRAEAKSRHFISHYGATSVTGVIDTDGNGRPGSVNTGIANTTLGQFFFQSESESRPRLATNVTCPAGTAEIPLLQALAVLTKESTGEQLFVTYTSGVQCFDPTTRTITFHGQGTFTGGTGRFVDATGTFEEDDTATLLVLDPQGHAFANITGTLTGVWDGGD